MAAPITGVCVVTGANGGLGKATSIELATRGATVVMVCRDAARGKAAMDEVVQRSGSRNVSLMLADLSSPADVRRLAGDIAAKHRAVRAFISTAAIYTSVRRVTADGLESMFATNHLAPYILTRLLLPVLDKGAPARVVIVSAPATTRPDFADLQGEKRFRPLFAFGASMVGKLLFAFALARRVDPARITVNAFHPGLMRSDLMRETPAVMRLLLRLISRRPDRAARHVADLVGGDLQAPNGSFVALGKVAKAPALSLDHDRQEEMWQASARLAGLPAE